MESHPFALSTVWSLELSVFAEAPARIAPRPVVQCEERTWPEQKHGGKGLEVQSS